VNLSWNCLLEQDETRQLGDQCGKAGQESPTKVHLAISTNSFQQRSSSVPSHNRPGVGQSCSRCHEAMPHALADCKGKVLCSSCLLETEKREIGHALLWRGKRFGPLTVRSACLGENRGCEGFEQTGLPDWWVDGSPPGARTAACPLTID